MAWRWHCLVEWVTTYGRFRICPKCHFCKKCDFWWRSELYVVSWYGGAGILWSSYIIWAIFIFCPKYEKLLPEANTIVAFEVTKWVWCCDVAWYSGVVGMYVAKDPESICGKASSVQGFFFWYCLWHSFLQRCSEWRLMAWSEWSGIVWCIWLQHAFPVQNVPFNYALSGVAWHGMVWSDVPLSTVVDYVI